MPDDDSCRDNGYRNQRRDGASGRHAAGRAIDEYDVTYEYAGRQYVTRTITRATAFA